MYDACLPVPIVSLLDDSVSFSFCMHWGKYFCDFLEMNKDPFFFIALSLFLALMIVFYISAPFYTRAIHTTYTCRHSEKRNYFSHSLFFMWFFFFFSESVSEFFYVFLFTALLLKKKLETENEYENFLRSGFQIFFVNCRKETELSCVSECSTSRWLTCALLYVGAWVSKQTAADLLILNYTYVKIKFNGNFTYKYN